MVELVAKSPCAGLLPLQVGKMQVQEVDPGVLSLLMPFAGQDGALSVALKAGHGVAAPGVGRMVDGGGCRVFWFGRGQLMLAGPRPDAGLARVAAISDQSDGWACVEFSGPQAEAALARLVPVDMRAAAFAKGQVVRSLIGHMQAGIIRLDETRFLLMVFRSMAGTLVHDLDRAMRAVAK